MKRKILLCLILLLSLLFVRNVLAFGVAYADFRCPDNPLKLFPGQEKITSLWLQNMADDDASVAVILREGAGIAEMETQNYLVKSKTEDTSVPITFKIPEDEPIGANHTVVIAFDTIIDGESGGVAIGTGMDVKVCVQIVPEYPVELSPVDKESGKAWYYVIGFVILAALIVVFVVRRKRANKSLR